MPVVDIVWNPQDIPDGAAVLYVHQHSEFPLTETLGDFDKSGTGFVAWDHNPPITTAFKQALSYAKREGVEALVIIDPVGFGRLELGRLAPTPKPAGNPPKE